MNQWQASLKTALHIILLAGLTACGGDSDERRSVIMAPIGQNNGDVAAAEWAPLPGSPPVSTEVQAARDAILGPDATDPNTVKLWWVGVSSYIANMGGHLVLLDAWESVGFHENTLPIGREELAAIQPEAIFIGHGHFDHAADTGYVAGRTGATVVAGQSVCDLARDRAAASGGEVAFPCLILGGLNDPEPGIVQPIRVFADLPAIHILQHIHSAAEPQDLLTGEMPIVFTPDLTTYILNANTNPEEMSAALQSLGDDGGFGNPAGGTWAYHFRVGDFSLLWHDSAGPIAEGNPYATEIQTALNSFPDCVDVQAGAIVGFGMVSSGLRDSRLYVEHAHPKLFVPGHHDAWAPVVGPGAAALETPWREELANLEHPPELDYLRDPEDYLAVREYQVDDPKWKSPMPGSSCSGT